MANEFASLIQADLASLTNAAAELSTNAIAPAHQFGATPGQSGQAGGPFSFAQSMREAVNKVNADDQMAAQKMADVDAGRSDDLVGAMLASQEASLSFSMLMQVRNKVMGAVEDLVKLPL
ncbi:flagellar hook-basal body complex protein FliE [Pseudoduganella namucuonensis]|uniref:Flagellar hook-basal body complex protein FliE n=1 Tax=Pseudoduganella namucuonensis TaxID=1035707 RepID=A0A1I7HTD0_9BURK|nr:flagellar hook-basal body complex protein FliE [Pseudoduganella namucuonensis]SFU63975.1 flagellar hook-basal body complex protein FliE [Pseudoduganella namucuonensis]